MKKIQDKLVEIQNKEAGAGKNVSNKIVIKSDKTLIMEMEVDKAKQ